MTKLSAKGSRDLKNWEEKTYSEIQGDQTGQNICWPKADGYPARAVLLYVVRKNP